MVNDIPVVADGCKVPILTGTAVPRDGIWYDHMWYPDGDCLFDSKKVEGMPRLEVLPPVSMTS